jgi:hypothetical protein
LAGEVLSYAVSKINQMSAKPGPIVGPAGVDTTNKDMLQRSRHRNLLAAFAIAAVMLFLFVVVQGVSVRDQNDDLRLIREAASSAAASSRDMEQCPADPVGRHACNELVTCVATCGW